MQQWQMFVAGGPLQGQQQLLGTEENCQAVCTYRQSVSCLQVSKGSPPPLQGHHCNANLLSTAVMLLDSTAPASSAATSTQRI